MFLLLIVIYFFFRFVSSEIKVVMKHELVKKHLQLLCSHNLVLFPGLAPNFGTFFNFDAFSQ